MNLAQMIKEVRRGLDELTPDFWTNEEITDWLNEGAKIMASHAQPIQAFFQFDTVAAQQEYALPEDFDELYSITHFRSSLTQLTVTSAAAAQFGNQMTGQPEQFYLRTLSKQTAGQGANGNIVVSDIAPAPTYRKVLGLTPIPSTSGDKITVFYYSQHFTMVDDEDVSPIPIEFHRGVVAYAAAYGKEKDEAYGEMQIKLKQFQEHADKLKIKMTNAGQETAFPQIKVQGEYGYVPSTVLYIPDGAAS